MAVTHTKSCSCGKTLYRTTSLETVGMIFQHGENPEHVFIVPVSDVLKLENTTVIHEWCERIHEYES